MGGVEQAGAVLTLLGLSAELLAIALVAWRFRPGRSLQQEVESSAEAARATTIAAIAHDEVRDEMRRQAREALAEQKREVVLFSAGLGLQAAAAAVALAAG